LFPHSLHLQKSSGVLWAIWASLCSRTASATTSGTASRYTQPHPLSYCDILTFFFFLNLFLFLPFSCLSSTMASSPRPHSRLSRSFGVTLCSTCNTMLHPPHLLPRSPSLPLTHCVPIFSVIALLTSILHTALFGIHGHPNLSRCCHSRI
jgi:hypothetical protein